MENVNPNMGGPIKSKSKNKTWLIVIILVVVILLVGAAVLLMKSPNSFISGGDDANSLKPIEEFEVNSADDILTGLKLYSGIEFGDIQSVNQMIWNVDGGDKILQIEMPGKQINAYQILPEEKDKVRPYFQGLGFEMDEYNVADGIVGGLVGYKKDNYVCRVLGRFSKRTEQGVPVANIHDVEVTCGELLEDNFSEVTLDVILKRLFAEKYNKPIDNIKLTPNMVSENHIRGMVNLDSDDSASEGGIFLATNFNGAWEIVFDGNGSYACSDLANYNFPADMITDCATE